MINMCRRGLLFFAAILLSLSSVAKSLVITLADAKGTRIYYKLGGEVNPKLVIENDGTFTLNARSYAFSNVKNFYYSATDYSGEANTQEDAIVAIEEDNLSMDGHVNVYDLDGRLVANGQRGVVMRALQRGTYIITNGVLTVKIQKQ